MLDSPERLSPQTCRAARKLLKLTQAELAGLARISVSTLRRFESGDGKASPYAARQILRALEKEGVVFVAPGHQPSLK